MTPALVGMFVLVLVGAYIGIMTAHRFTRDSSLKHSVVGFIAGIAFIGVGTFGPTFLSDLGDFVVVALEHPNRENLGKIVRKVDDGSIPPELARALLLRYSELNVPGFESELQKAADETDHPAKRAIFEWGLEYDRRQTEIRAELARPEVQEQLSPRAKEALLHPTGAIRDLRLNGVRLDRARFDAPIRPDGK